MILKRLKQLGDVAPELTALRSFCDEQGKYLRSAVKSDCAPHLREGGVIADGFDPELDRLRDIGVNSQAWLAKYQATLASQSAINSLRVGYNKVFGYYIEVTDAHRAKVPAEWSRKQTIKNAERYVTDELKKFEEESLGAQDKAIGLEQALFDKIRQALLPHLSAFQDLAAELARVDVLCAL